MVSVRVNRSERLHGVVGAVCLAVAVGLFYWAFRLLSGGTPAWYIMAVMVLTAFGILVLGVVALARAVTFLVLGALRVQLFPDRLVVGRSHSRSVPVQFTDIVSTRRVDAPPDVTLELTHRDGTVWVLSSDGSRDAADLLSAVADECAAVSVDSVDDRTWTGRPSHSPVTPSPRATSASAELGAHDASLALNRRRETDHLPGAVAGAVGTATLIGMSAIIPGVWWLALFALAPLAFGVFELSRFLHYRRLGELHLHLYTDGFLLERTRGGLWPHHYRDVTEAVLCDYTETGDEGRDGPSGVVLKLTLADGTSAAMSTLLGAGDQILVDLWHRCGATERVTVPASNVDYLLRRYSEVPFRWGAGHR